MKALLLISCILFATLAGPNQSLFAKEEKIEQAIPAATPVAVLGGGIGALTSALYLARAGVEVLVIEGPNPGGLIVQSHSVQNWPGELEISGQELANKVRKQAEANGARFTREMATAVDFSNSSYALTLKNLDTNETRTLHAESVIVAMGTRPNFLGIPGESGPTGYWGRGVTNCAICDGALYRDMTVGVVGGGDAAVLEALYLSNIAAKVNVFVRKDSFKALEEKRLQTLLAKPNVKVFYNTTVERVKGDGTNVTGIEIKKSGKTKNFPLDGLFLAIGSTPNTELFQNALPLDNKGYIVLKKDQETKLPGIYAIGDIVDPVYKQAISAAGDGAKAAMQAQQFVSDRKNSLVQQSPKEKKETVLVLPKKEVIEITSMEQFKKELKGDMPIFVDFYATWCGPCKQVYPRIEQSADHLSGRVKFLKVNIDLVEKLASTYKIRAMPTALLMNPEGEVLERKVGYDQVVDLLKSLEK